MTHDAASSRSFSLKGACKDRVADVDRDDVASCMRSGMSWARMRSSSSVSIRSRISDGSNTCAQR